MYHSLLGTSPRWHTFPQRRSGDGPRARCRSRVRERSRAFRISRSADSQPARVSSEAVGSASGPPPATSFPALRPARPPLQRRPLGRPSVGAKEVRLRAIPHLLLRRRLPSRVAYPAQVVSRRTAPLTHPSQAGAGRSALPQQRFPSLASHLPARAKLEMLGASRAARARPSAPAPSLPASDSWQRLAPTQPILGWDPRAHNLGVFSTLRPSNLKCPA